MPYLAAGAMMLPFVPGLGATINDANSWVRFGTFGFQPSEILKLAAIAFLADLFARHQEELHCPAVAWSRWRWSCWHAPA